MPENSESKKPQEITSSSPRSPWKVFFWEAFLFSLTLGLGIANAFKLNQFLKIEKIILPQVSFWKLITTFLLAVLFIFLLIHSLKFKKKKGVIFKIIFILTVSLGGLLFLEVWLIQPLPLIVITALVFWWWKRPSILNQNILMISGIAGIGSIVGLALQPPMVVILLIIFSIYDYVAVYKTKHMVKMAKEMIEQKAILALIIPLDISGFKANLEEIRLGGKFLVLGGGDIIFPLLFSASLISQDVIKSIIVAIFALFGLFCSFYIFLHQKTPQQPIPALPPIALFSIIGFLVSLLI